MNILHISPYFPALEANHAGGVCMGKQIEALKKNHQVYVLTFEASEYDKRLKEIYAADNHYKSVKISKWSRLFHILLEPWMPAYFAARTSFRFSLLLVYMVKKYHIDAVHAEYASMGQYLWLRRMFPHLSFNMTEHDMTAQSYERKMAGSKGIHKLYIKWQLFLVRAREKRYCNAADVLFTFNQKDRRLISEEYGRSDCLVLNPYYGLEDELLEQKVEEAEREENCLCFLGQMGRDENYMAAMRLINICERLKKKLPGLQVYIVGNKPPEPLKKMENDHVHITGFVEDVDIYLKKAKLAVFPLTMGAGIKLKVLRSLALGTPVITGQVGAEGIDEEGQVIIHAETDQEYEDRILEYLGREDDRKQIAIRSRDYIREHFGWHVSERVLGEVYGK